MVFKRAFILLALLLSACLGRAALVINEVCYDNSVLLDENGAAPDWIELYNSGPGSVNIFNYGLDDESPFVHAPPLGAGNGLRLPDYTIPGGGYLVVLTGVATSNYTTWVTAPDIAVIPENATWKFSAPSSAPASTWMNTTFVDTTWSSGMSPFGYNDATLNMDCATVLGYGGNPANRYPTAYFRKTFNLINPSVVTGLVVTARINDGMVLYLNGVEVLRNIMPLGAIAYTTLANIAVPPTEWTTFLVPTNGLIRGSNLIAVEVHQASVASPDLIMDMHVKALVHEQVPIAHGQFGLTKAGENVHLFDSTLFRIHKFDAPVAEPGENRSYGLASDGVIGTYKTYAKPTPGLPNATYTQKYQPTLTNQLPRFSVAPGFYQNNQSVTLTTPSAGYRIYYTLDGSDPWNSTTYVNSGSSLAVNAASAVSSGLSWLRTNPVEITNNVPSAGWQAPIGTVAKAVVLRTIAVDSATLSFCSPERRGTYFIGNQFTNRVLPIVSVTTDTNNLFDFVSGIYVPGKEYADSPVGYGDNKWGKPYANYHQDSNGVSWERPVQVELLETNRTTMAFTNSMGISMYGGGTRSLPQKTLYLISRLSEYGVDAINYKLFPDETASSYKRFLLRNSGNDWYGMSTTTNGIATMMKDAVFHRMVKGLDLALLAYRPVSVYINGEYWGIQNLRESVDKHYFATRYGLDPDNIDILMHEDDPAEEGNVLITRVDGSTSSDEDYEATLDWVDLHPLSSPANYTTVQSWMDVTNHADYIIAETFFGNTDWPINNCDFWRAHTNQVATCGKYGDRRWRWVMYDLDMAGDKGTNFNMFTYLSGNDMTGKREPGFLINQLWSNDDFRNFFINRYANLLNTTFRPERMSQIITQAANAIQSDIEKHFRRWGRTYTKEQWQQEVNTALIQYTAARHALTFNHLDAKFGLGGTGSLTVRNENPAGVGGRFLVNGLSLTNGTEGVTNRAVWTGTFFQSLAVPVQAIPDDLYVFDRWVGTAVTNPSPSLFVGTVPLVLTARFRLATETPSQPTGYERWQVDNYLEAQVLGGVDAAPEAPSGYAGMSNFQLYAFGMNRDGLLSDEERLARASLTINNYSNLLWVGYTRLNNTFTDVSYTLKITPSLEMPIFWSNAVMGVDLDPRATTNILDPRTWHYDVRLPAASPAKDKRFFKLEVLQQ
jgi:hypothetical protein